jgi:hypothetical protein
MCAVFVLAGCAASNEGAVDYRKAEATMAVLPPGKFSETEKDPLQPLHLIRKNYASWDGDAALVKGDSITIRLRQSRITDCIEIPNPFDDFIPNCEIAVVVHAFEFGKGEDFDFGPDAAKKGRIVFFSPDVRAGQTLNFDNMPIYGPITYNGGPIGLNIFVIEIDDSNEQFKALLNTIAKTGGTIYPPASPVLKVLDQIGTALLSGGTDDIELRYTIVLDPDGKVYERLNFARLFATSRTTCLRSR